MLGVSGCNEKVRNDMREDFSAFFRSPTPSGFGCVPTSEMIKTNMERRALLWPPSHGWSLICVKALTFPPQVSARKAKWKRCYQQPSFRGKEIIPRLPVIHSVPLSFSSHLEQLFAAWLQRFAGRGWKDQTDNPQHVSWFYTTVMQYWGSSEALLDFLKAICPPPPWSSPLPSGHLLPFILLSFSRLSSRFTPCRYLHVFVFTHRLGSAYGTLWHTLDP